MIGVILAGGNGTRLNPLTKVTSKQLLPIYDKPLVFYPFSTLLLAGIKEFLIITKPEDESLFRKVLGNFEKIELKFATQNQPRGISDALIIANQFYPGEKVALILGDNIFHGPGLGRELSQYTDVEGAHIFGFKVKNPKEYGVVEIFEDRIISMEEKPQKPKSDVAITGLYFFDENYYSHVLDTSVSSRGELEIVDVLKSYLRENMLRVSQLSRGVAWFDTGTFNGLHDASSYVRIIQERTGLLVGDPQEIIELQTN